MRDAFWYGAIWGIGLFGTSLSFVFTMLPFDWLGISSSVVGVIAATSAWSIVSAMLALSVGLFALVVWHIRSNRAVLLVGAPLLWAVLEIVRALFVSFAALGPGTSLGADFTIGNLAYALAWSPGLLSLFGPLGLPFLSGLIVFLNAITYVVIRDLATMRAALMLVAMPVALVAINMLLPAQMAVQLGSSSAIIKGVEIALTHTDIDATLTVSRAAQVAQTDKASAAIIETLAQHPDARVVVMPEDSRYVRTALQASSSVSRAAIELLKERNMLMLDSARLDRGTEARDLLYAYDFARASTTHMSAKAYLAPFGEYVPYIVHAGAQVLGFGDAIKRLIASRSSYVPGIWQAEGRIVEIGGVRLGMLSCSELFAPRFMRDLAQENVDAIVLMSSQSWIRQDSQILFNQMLGMAIVQSAVVGKPYLQATNRAPNIVITF